MKALRIYRLRFHGQMFVIGILAMVGLMALGGEPDESLAFGAWLRVFGCQLAVCASCWLGAYLLCRHWGLGRKMAMLDRIEKGKRLAQCGEDEIGKSGR